MPLAEIHVLEGRYDQNRMAKVSAAIQAALMDTLRVPAEDFYQLIFFATRYSPFTTSPPSPRQYRAALGLNIHPGLLHLVLNL